MKRGAEVVAVAPTSAEPTESFAKEHGLPFPCLPDPDHHVFDIYGVESKALSLGQRPGLFVIDKQGVVRYAHIGNQQWEIPSVDVVLEVLDRENR